MTREEMKFGVGAARFDVARDRDILGWIFSQALFGEATGCYCGAALYTAPDVGAGMFLARQSVEEFAHFRSFLKIFRILGVRPQPPNRVIKFLTSHESLWEHHVCLEMAVGEGLVLIAFDAFIDTIDHPEIKAILKAVSAQEVGHTEFGEQETLKALAARPGLRRQLLGRCLVTIAALRFLAKRISRWVPKGHPVMDLMPRFLEHTIRVTEERMRRLGLLRGKLDEICATRRWSLMAYGVLAAFARGLVASKKPRIPENYLQDPIIDEYLGGGGGAREPEPEPEPATTR